MTVFSPLQSRASGSITYQVKRDMSPWSIHRPDVVELLETAILATRYRHRGIIDMKTCCGLMASLEGQQEIVWNPLQNTEQAIRLTIEFDLAHYIEGRQVFAGPRLESWSEVVDVGQDPLFSTRLAITKAVASIAHREGLCDINRKGVCPHCHKHAHRAKTEEFAT